MPLLPLYLSPSGALVEAGCIKGRQATRLNVSSAPVGSSDDSPRVASGHHLVPVEVGDSGIDALATKPGLVLVLEPEGLRVVHEIEFMAAYSLVKAVNLHDRANPASPG